jgi:hypothetical protein
MSSNDFDLLNPANAYSRSGNAQKPFASPTDEADMPTWPASYTDRTAQKYEHRYKSAVEEPEEEEEEAHARESLKDAFDGATLREEDEELNDPSSMMVAEGQRLIIAIDYGTTFTGK